MGNPGYIYALINPSLEGLVKVGKTTTNPEKRANELSSVTGVPMQFIVAYSVIVTDCDLAEKYAHGILEKNGFRVSSKREFFQAPLPVAIDAIKSTASFIGILTESELYSCYDDSIEDDYFDNSTWADLELEADIYYKTPWSTIDVDKLIELYNKAAVAGCVRAYYQQGCIHLLEAQQLVTRNNQTLFQKFFGGDSASKNHKHIHTAKGLENHRMALKNGYDLSYAALADYFGDIGSNSEAKKHWDLFFQSNTFRKHVDPYNDFGLYYHGYKSFLFLNLKMEQNEAEYHAAQKFDI